MNTIFDYEIFLACAPTQPGIYKMLDVAGKIIYVGKAKNLKNRLNSYFQDNLQSPKTRVLVSRIADIHCIVTQTENEALLLEQTLIKEHRPRYNVLLRDDKSYPFIYLSHHIFPNLRFTRQKKHKKGQYFGPYSKPSAVKETIELIQRFFKIRNCEDSFFANRTRPCLQYQIKRCKAPCVNFVSQEEYAQDIKNAVLFLEGKSQIIIDSLTQQMQQASEERQFEKAIECRDQIQALQNVLQKQHVIGLEQDKDFDFIFGLIAPDNMAIVQKILVRQGNLLDNLNYTFSLPQEMDVKEMLDAFLPQHYLVLEEVPASIYVNEESQEHSLLAAVLSEKRGHAVSIIQPKRGEKTQWLELARVNALQTLEQYQAKSAHYAGRFEDLKDLLQLDQFLNSPPSEGWQPQADGVVDSKFTFNLLCFDISHTLGEATVASCVAFNEQGPDKKSYRRFNITDITGGDDYAAMRQALMRYYESSVMPAKAGIHIHAPLIKGVPVGRGIRSLDRMEIPPNPPLSRGEPLNKEDSNEAERNLNILLIDGGKGQLTQAETILTKLKVQNTILLGIAKGEGRKSGLETIFLNSQGDSLDMTKHPQAFLLLQEIRDEAHRFAITGHRNKRDKKRRTSTLEMIEGIGPARRQKLLTHFGGLQGLKAATVEQIAKVPGISQALAKKIFEVLSV